MQSNGTLILVVIYLILNRNLLDTALMTTTFKCGCKELVHYGFSRLVVYKATRKNQYICIVVLTNKAGNLNTPCQSCANCLMLVQANRHTFSTAAYSNAWINFATFYTFSQLVSEIRIVNT